VLTLGPIKEVVAAYRKLIDPATEVVPTQMAAVG
jgi:hypothetical protein